MTPTAALWTSVVLGSCAQVFLKKGLPTRENNQERLSYIALLGSGWVWAWGVCFFLATALWLLALSKIQVSYAFPLLSVGYPIVTVLSIFMLGERVTSSRWLAILVITAGVALIWRSA